MYALSLQDCETFRKSSNIIIEIGLLDANDDFEKKKSPSHQYQYHGGNAFFVVVLII